MGKINEVKKAVDKAIKDSEGLKRKKDLSKRGEGSLLIAKTISKTLGTEKGEGCLVMIASIAKKLGPNHKEWIAEYKTLYY